MKKHAAPIIAAVLLLLPVLYVGSYLALVDPYCRSKLDPSTIHPYFEACYTFENYRIGGSVWGTIFWPLESVDQKLRPKMWETTPANMARGQLNRSS